MQKKGSETLTSQLKLRVCTDPGLQGGVEAPCTLLGYISPQQNRIQYWCHTTNIDPTQDYRVNNCTNQDQVHFHRTY